MPNRSRPLAGQAPSDGCGGGVFFLPSCSCGHHDRPTQRSTGLCRDLARSRDGITPMHHHFLADSSCSPAASRQVSMQNRRAGRRASRRQTDGRAGKQAARGMSVMAGTGTETLCSHCTPLHERHSGSGPAYRCTCAGMASMRRAVWDFASATGASTLPGGLAWLLLPAASRALKPCAAAYSSRIYTAKGKGLLYRPSDEQGDPTRLRRRPSPHPPTPHPPTPTTMDRPCKRAWPCAPPRPVALSVHDCRKTSHRCA